MPLGASCIGKAQTVPQVWSAALFAHPDGFDGVAYTARHDDQALRVALFERGAAAVETLSQKPDLDRTWFWTLAEPYGVGLAPS